MPKSPTFPDCFDEAKQIAIADLTRLGFLRPDAVARGPLRWMRGDKPSGEIAIIASLSDRYIELSYNYGEKPIRYRVRLEAVPKHFGGLEWYFICPTTLKRCKKLYGIGEYFLSRYAYPSAMYSRQRESNTYRRLFSTYHLMRQIEDHLNKRHARTSYNGNLTKRFARFLNRQDRHQTQ